MRDSDGNVHARTLRRVVGAFLMLVGVSGVFGALREFSCHAPPGYRCVGGPDFIAIAIDLVIPALFFFGGRALWRGRVAQPSARSVRVPAPPPDPEFSGPLDQHSHSTYSPHGHSAIHKHLLYVHHAGQPDIRILGTEALDDLHQTLHRPPVPPMPPSPA